MAAAGAAMLAAPASAQSTNDYDKLPATLTVNAVIRDFKGADQPGGHPDFESYSGGNIRVGLVRSTLGDDGKPRVASLSGKLVSSNWKDKSGRIIMPGLYDPSRGDVAGSYASSTPANIKSVDGFASWYNDVPGVNMTSNVPLTLVRTPGTNRYVMDSATQDPWKGLGGFFPINGAMYGNYSTTGRNFHFTTEIEATFMYSTKTANVFMFSGDDDVWVFIDGKLVMDLGGLHPRCEQYLDLSRLGWLEDGKSYTLKIFHAERHTTQSNFRMETTLNLKSVSAPTTSALYD